MTTFYLVYPECPHCSNRVQNEIDFGHSGRSWTWYETYRQPWDGEGSYEYAPWNRERLITEYKNGGRDYNVNMDCYIQDEYNVRYDLETFLAQILQEPINPPKFVCPFCNWPVTQRNQRLDGDDCCSKGHKYPSHMSIEVKDGTQ